MSEQITFNRIIMKSGKTFIALCPELNISVESDSSDSARKLLITEVAEFLTSAKKDRQLSTILEDGGYVKTGDQWLPLHIEETGTDNAEI